MSIAKRIYYKGVQLLPLSLLNKMAPQRLLLPYHHLVSDEHVPHIRHLYPYKGTKAFSRDLDYLLRNFKPVSLQDVITCVRQGRELPKNAFLLTFDDGLKEIRDVVAPMLLARGVPAAFFINKAFVDNQTLFYKFAISLAVEALTWDTESEATLKEVARITGLPETATAPKLIETLKAIRYQNRDQAYKAAEVLGFHPDDYLHTHKPFMHTEDLKRLASQGFAIGGHSVDHPYYTGLSINEMIQQTLESVDFAASICELDYRAFAFPHSDAGVPREFFERVLEHETNALDIIFGTNNQRGDIYPQIIHRFNCERPDQDISASVKGILTYGSIQKARGKQIVTRN